MNEADQIDSQVLARRMARWSDGHEPEAVRQAETYRPLRPKPLTNAQLSSLQNIVEAAPVYSEIRDYLRHQAEKANKAGPAQTELKNYWLDLDKTLGQLRQEAETILTAVALKEMTRKDRQTRLDEIHRRLIREYVQHLVAHFLYLTPIDPKEDNR
jgi:hypothetical protein